MVNLRITVKLCDGDGNPLPNKLVHVYYSFNGSEWLELVSKETDQNGEVIASHTVNRNVWYKAVFEGDDVYDYAEGTAFFNYTSYYASTYISFMFNWLIIVPLMIASIIFILNLLRKHLKD